MKFLKIKTFTSTVTIRHLVSPRQSNAEPPGNHDIYKSNWSQRVSITVRVRSSIWAGAPQKKRWMKKAETVERQWDGRMWPTKNLVFILFSRAHTTHSWELWECVCGEGKLRQKRNLPAFITFASLLAVLYSVLLGSLGDGLQTSSSTQGWLLLFDIYHSQSVVSSDC